VHFKKKFGLLQPILNLDYCCFVVCRCSVYFEWAYIAFVVSDYKVDVPCVIEKQNKKTHLQLGSYR